MRRRSRRARTLARLEGIIPALESSHAVAEAIRRAPSAAGSDLCRQSYPAAATRTSISIARTCRSWISHDECSLRPRLGSAACSRRAKAQGRKAFIAYLTAGDPTPAHTASLVLALERGGADLIELGVPFSDPIADGPVIQRASDRALAAGATLSGLLETVREIRRHSEIPLLLFSYLNPLLRYGFGNLARDAAEAGIDGVLLTDLSVEEAAEPVRRLREQSLDTVFLAAPTSTERRLRLVAEHSSGFIYLVSRTGVTGRASFAFFGGRSADRADAAAYRSSARGRLRHRHAGAGCRSGAAGRCGGGGQRDRAVHRNARRISGLGRASGDIHAQFDCAPARFMNPPMSHFSPDDLKRCRVEIDELDLRLLELLNERTRIVEEIGRIKQALHLGIYEPKREDQVFANVTGHNRRPAARRRRQAHFRAHHRRNEERAKAEDSGRRIRP